MANVSVVFETFYASYIGQHTTNSFNINSDNSTSYTIKFTQADADLGANGSTSIFDGHGSDSDVYGTIRLYPQDSD
jgi:hypothetical protein